MGQNAKVTRYGSHVVKKKAKKGETQNANEGRRKLRSVLKEAKKRLREEQAVGSSAASDKPRKPPAGRSDTK